MSGRVNIVLDDLDAGYKSGSCSDESSVDIEVEDTEPATRRSSSVVHDVEVTDVTPAPTRSAGWQHNNNWSDQSFRNYADCCESGYIIYIMNG